MALWHLQGAQERLQGAIGQFGNATETGPRGQCARLVRSSGLRIGPRMALSHPQNWSQEGQVASLCDQVVLG